MKTILALLLIPLISYSQDTIVNKILTSYFSNTYHNPTHVSYKLYKGGGDCNRSNLSFTTAGLINSSTKSDYKASGLDIGHLCPAEDFAYDCTLEKETFYFYNAVPQYPNLNRGIWKHYETEIRKDSQTDSLLIIAGAIYKHGFTISNTKVHIPIFCWKLVKSLSTGKILYCLLFTNESEKNTVKHISTNQLEKLIGYKIL